MRDRWGISAQLQIACNIKDGMVRRITWQEYLQLFDSLCMNLTETGVEGRTVVGIERGGLIASVMISHAFDLPHMAIRPGFLPEPPIRPLIVDDICDTGDMFEKMMRWGGQDAIFAAILGREQHKLLVVGGLHDTPDWVVFPWEVPLDQTIRGIKR